MSHNWNLTNIALAVESILSDLGHPEVESLSIDRWDISLRTAHLIPGVKYEETTFNGYIISRAEITYNDEIAVELSHVELGKVARA